MTECRFLEKGSVVWVDFNKNLPRWPAVVIDNSSVSRSKACVAVLLLAFLRPENVKKKCMDTKMKVEINKLTRFQNLDNQAVADEYVSRNGWKSIDECDDYLFNCWNNKALAKADDRLCLFKEYLKRRKQREHEKRLQLSYLNHRKNFVPRPNIVFHCLLGNYSSDLNNSIRTRTVGKRKKTKVARKSL